MNFKDFSRLFSKESKKVELNDDIAVVFEYQKETSGYFISVMRNSKKRCKRFEITIYKYQDNNRLRIRGVRTGTKRDRITITFEVNESSANIFIPKYLPIRGWRKVRDIFQSVLKNL